MNRARVTSSKEHQSWLSQFHPVESDSSTVPWVRSLRKKAISRFEALGIPTTRQEAWKYTNLGDFSRISFQPAQRDNASALALDTVSPFLLKECEAIELVFVDGAYNEALSRGRETMRHGIEIKSLKAAFQSEASLIEPYFSSVASFSDDAFTALNTALAEDGAFIHVTQKKRIEAPVHLVHISTALNKNTSRQIRHLVRCESESSLTLIQTFVGMGSEIYFNNALTEIVLEAAASVDFYSVQREEEQAYGLSKVAVRQQRDSRFRSHAISLGSQLGRNEINVRLGGENAECELGGLFFASRNQHIDNYTTVDHVKPNTSSSELYKGILADKGVGVFNGQIIVRADAQKIEARQKSQNLLLSEEATINTKPQLEIYANDVKCTHGATIGQLEEEALFYLRSRGIPEKRARGILTNAFAGDILGRIKVVPLRAKLESWFNVRLGMNIGEGEIA